MDITEKAFFGKSLSVGGLLSCISMTNEGPTKVGGTINAKNSTFKDVAIKSTSRYVYGNNISVNSGTVIINGTVINASNNSVVTYSSFPCMAPFYYIWQFIRHLFCGSLQNIALIEDQRSEFENCTIESLSVDKNNNAKQIIELKNTYVADKIVFAPNTKGEVWMHGNSQVGNQQTPNVQNGSVLYK